MGEHLPCSAADAMTKSQPLDHTVGGFKECLHKVSRMFQESPQRANTKMETVDSALIFALCSHLNPSGTAENVSVSMKVCVLQCVELFKRGDF